MRVALTPPPRPAAGRGDSDLAQCRLAVPPQPPRLRVSRPPASRRRPDTAKDRRLGESGPRRGVRGRPPACRGARGGGLGKAAGAAPLRPRSNSAAAVTSRVAARAGPGRDAGTMCGLRRARRTRTRGRPAPSVCPAETSAAVTGRLFSAAHQLLTRTHDSEDSDASGQLRINQREWAPD